jgi:hypothetical protein
MREETPDGYYIHIGLCDRLRQPVANPAIRFGEPNPMWRVLRSEVSGQVTVTFQPQYFPHPMQGIGSAVDALWPLMVTPVMEGRFSFHAGKFHRFGPNDRAFVEAALFLSDDEEL